MKQTIIFMLLCIGSFKSYSQELTDAPPPPLQEQNEIDRKAFVKNSKTIVSLRNNTGNKLYVSYVAYDSDEQSWTSHGWYDIDAYSTISLPLGNYKGAIYFHAHNSNGSQWGDKWNFCIDKTNAFEIVNSDKINCDNKYKFTKTNVGPGMANKWTFNP